MNLFKLLRDYFVAFWSIKADETNKDVYTVTCDESIRLGALPDMLPPRDSEWEAANDLANFKVIDVYPDSNEVFVMELDTELTYTMNVDVFDLLFSKRVESTPK